jgi:NNP family nitrate/nitrite transporter-like MFS transporter
VLGLVASGNIGTVLILLLAPRWESVFGWRGACGIMLIPIVLTLGLFARVVRQEPLACSITGDTWWRAAREMIRVPSVYWLCLIYGITFGGFVGLTSYLPVLLHDVYARDPIVGGSIAALCGLMGSLIRPVGGYVADRWGGLPVLVGVFVVLALMSLLTASLPALAWAVGLLVILVAAMGFGNGVIFQIVSEWFPKDIGLASGLVGAAGGIGGFLVPIWFGFLRESTGTFTSGFIALAVVSASAAMTVSPALRWRLRRVTQASNADGFSR